MKDLFGNGLWLIFGSIVSNFISFIYIFLISQSVHPEVVGTLGAIMALQAALGVFLSLGIPTGIQMFVGSAQGRGDPDEIRSTFLTNMIALIIMNTIGTVILVALSIANIGLLQFSPPELLLIAAIHFLSSVSPILLALFIAMLESRIAAYALIVSSAMKIPIGLFAITHDPSIFSVCSGIIASYFVLDLFLIYQWKRRVGVGSRLQIRLEHFRQVVKAGRPSWVVTIFTALGQAIGIIVVFNVSGGLSTGLYYIAFAVASIVFLIPSSILGVLFPLLSGMDSGKKDAAARAIRLGMVTTVPITLALFAYAEIPLAILGEVYAPATTILRLLLIGALFYSIVVGYNSYAYSERKYQTVFILGISMNMFRLIAYYPLVIMASGTGAAIAYSLGVLVGVVVVVIFSMKGGLRMEWYTHCKILLVPMLSTAILIVLRIHVAVGLPALLFLTLLSYGRMKVFTRADLKELLGLFLAPDQIKRLLLNFRPVVNLVFGN